MRIFSILLGAMVLKGSSVFTQNKAAAFRAYEQVIPGSSVKFTMVPVKGGVFLMGSPPEAHGRKQEEGPPQKVSVSSFWIGACEVTYDEFGLFMRDEQFSQNEELDAITRPSQPYLDFSLGMGKEGGYPANSMSQYGALMYCRWLYKKTGIFYRLPTEAEWEYACRAGTSTSYFFGDDSAGLKKYAWYWANSEGHYHKVAQLQPNPWGLYDMLGNVMEWTLDQYDEKYFEKIGPSSKDPVILPTARFPRALRGGYYAQDANSLRSANRFRSSLAWNQRDPQIPRSKWWNADAPFVGFRLVRPFEQPAPDQIEQFFRQYLGK